MLLSSNARVFSLAEWPVAVSLVTAARVAELASQGGGEPRALSRSEALWLFDRRAGEAGAALRAFVHEHAWGPALSLLSDRELAAHVRKQIAAGALVALFEGQAEAKPRARRPRPTESSPVPLRRAPPPTAPADEPPEKDVEFPCPEAQALALVAAAESGVPFCAECARAAAARGAGAGA